MKKCTFSMGDECTALTEKQCFLCPFCKTSYELEAGRKKAAKRISTLPLSTQNHIKRKYYSR